MDFNIKVDEHPFGDILFIEFKGKSTSKFHIDKEDIKALRKVLKKYQPKTEKKFKVGDRVVSKNFGEGIIKYINKENTTYTIFVEFDDGHKEEYTEKGLFTPNNSAPYNNIKKVKPWEHTK